MAVAPRAGAWIETTHRAIIELTTASHPARVRGLKRELIEETEHIAESHPARVRGLKPSGSAETQLVSESHPARVRGLKHFLALCVVCFDGRTPRGCVD